jgi:hypothetical protein
MQANLLALSKQGNVEAIAALINRSLQPKGITAKVLLKDTCLKIMLEAVNVPDQQTLAPFIFKGVSNLSIPLIKTIQVYGRQQGEKAPVWTQVFNPNSAELDLPDFVPDSEVKTDITDASQGQAANFELASQGSLPALETALNRFVDDEDIAIKVEKEGTLLKVIAQTNKFLDGPSFSKGIHQELLRLNLEQIETVEIYKQKPNGSYSFRVQSFTLIKPKDLPVESEEPVSSSATKLATQTDSSQNGRSQKIASTSQELAPKKKENINGIRRKLTIGLIAIVAGFVIFRLIKRLAWAFSSPFGWFSIIMGLFFVWRAWDFLGPLLQQLLRDE